MPFDSIDDAIDDIHAGKFVIIVDDEQRENEGDLAIAADHISADQVNFLLRHARGMICVAAEGWRLDELGVGDMVDDNTSHHGTAFTVSVDAIGNGVTTGISAYDRAVTIRQLADREFGPTSFARPGHTHPLRARRGGVLERAGHTEAIVDLCKAAGREPAGVICEILNEDGTMARRPDLERFAREHGLRMVSIDDLIAWRRRSEVLVRRGAETVLPTQWGSFRVYGYEDLITHQVHVALVHGAITPDEPALVRVHSECLTGDVFGSQRCDCQAQLHKAMAMIGEAGSGVVVYLRQEGRGIGLLDKLRAYALQDRGMDTVQANEHLGLPADKRDYGIGAQILADLGIRRIRAVSNNPRKFSGLLGHGIEVVEQVPLATPPNAHNIRYLRTKRDKMGHALEELDVAADGAPLPGETSAG